MNKKNIRFIICMLLSVAMLLTITVGVLAEEDDVIGEDDVLTDDGAVSDENDDVVIEEGTDDSEGEDSDDWTEEEPTEDDPYASYEYICGDKENGLAMYYDKEGGNGLFYLQETVNGETVRWHSTVDQEILYEVIHGGPQEESCKRLLDTALQRGAPDNVTAVLLQM